MADDGIGVFQVVAAPDAEDKAELKEVVENVFRDLVINGCRWSHAYRDKYKIKEEKADPTRAAGFTTSDLGFRRVEFVYGKLDKATNEYVLVEPIEATDKTGGKLWVRGCRLVWDLRLQIRINADRFERYREDVRKHEECHCVDARRARALVIPLVEKRLRDLFDAESKAVAGSGKQNWKQNAETRIRAQLQSVSDSYKGVFCSVWGATAKEWDSKNGINKANWDRCGKSKVSFGS